MSGKLSLRLAILVSLGVFLSAAWAQGPAGSGGDGVLLLRNGQVVAGQIRQQPGYYEVVRPDGSLRLRTADVEMVCRDLDEGYQRKRAQIQPGKIEEHLRLAQWCQRQGLLGSAANELAAASEIDPRHPMIEVLQRRLNLAIEDARRPKPEPTAQPVAPARRGPTNEELDQMVREMPPGTVEMFVQAVQPLLLNNCTTSGCHSTHSNKQLDLLRPMAGQSLNRRITQRNLHAALQEINWEDPGESPLLTVLRKPHGNSKVPLLGERYASQQRRLVEWAYRVAQKPVPPEVLQFDGGSGGVVATGFDDLAAPPVGSSRHRSVRRPPVNPAHAVQPANRSDRTTPEPEKKPAAPADQSLVDPFDPAAFNQGQPPKSPEEPASSSSVPTPAARLLQK